MIYFDNGATSFPKPERVLRAMQETARQNGANPGRSGHKMSIDAAVKVYEVREAAANLFGAEQVEDVIFTSNCTHAINFALKGALNRGDHVIISDLDHNAVLRPIHTLAQRGIITYSVAQTGSTAEETVKAFRRLIRPNTKMIACTHGSNVFGIQLPIKEIGLLAQEQDVLFLVDAAQTAGVVDIDMQDCHIDFLCAAGHKSLYGPSGTGLLITPLGNALDTLFEGGTGTLSADYNQPVGMPERLESGTLNMVGIMGLGAGLAYIKEKGIDKIYAHGMKVGGELYRGLEGISGVTLYTSSPKAGKHLPVISFNMEGLSSEEATAMLSDKGFALRGGLHCAPLAHKKMGTLESGTVRASIGAFNTVLQAEQLCNAVKKLAKGL